MTRGKKLQILSRLCSKVSPSCSTKTCRNWAICAILSILFVTFLPFFFVVQCNNCFGNFSGQSRTLTLTTIQNCEGTLSHPPIEDLSTRSRVDRDDLLVKAGKDGFGFVLHVHFIFYWSLEILHVVITRWALNQGALETLSKARLYLFKFFRCEMACFMVT